MMIFHPEKQQNLKAEKIKKSVNFGLAKKQ